MPLSEAQVQSVLRSLVDPNTGKDFVATRSARNLKLSGEEVSLEIELGYPGKSQHEPIRRQVTQALKQAGAASVAVKVSSKVVAHAVQRGVKLVPGIKNIIAVASASRPPRPIWHSRCPPKAHRSACWMPISTGLRSR
jgi:ATP-binding protein involved in chromosome partitioning